MHSHRLGEVEPDECYVLDRDLTDDDYPDIALEVVIRSGGIDKLEVYRGLGVREVWFWHRGAFRLFELGAAGYIEVPRSGLVPALYFDVLASFAERADQHEALKSYRDRLRQTSG
ncbi:MAG TPA: Uma2 family endonuclease [Polyangiaceae bacterium]